MRISIAQARTRCIGPCFGFSEGCVLLPRCACFLSYVYFVWQAWHFRDNFEVNVVLASNRCKTSDTFHPRGRRGAFCTLLKCLQACVKIRGGFGCHFSWQAWYLMNFDDLF